MADQQTTATVCPKWHAHLDCGCWLKFVGKPRLGHIVRCTQHGARPVRSVFELGPDLRLKRLPEPWPACPVTLEPCRRDECSAGCARVGSNNGSPEVDLNCSACPRCGRSYQNVLGHDCLAGSGRCEHLDHDDARFTAVGCPGCQNGSEATS